MQENIRINEENEKVYLSEEMLSKIKNLIKGYNYLRKEEIDALSTNGINYYDFRSIIDSIARNFNINSDVMLCNDGNFQLDVDLLNEVQNLCRQYLQLNPTKEDRELLRIFRNKNDMFGLEQLINLVTQIKQTEDKMYLLRDLTNAKDDYIKDMQYFMNEEDINKFNLEYSQAIKEKNTDKMKQMLSQVQQLILKEWENYIGNIDTMSDENFCFLGHSTSSAKYDGDFSSRYVSCSLFNQNVNDTYRSGFGFMMMPKNIVGANSGDMYVNNYSYDEEYLLSYSSIPKIHHPQRLIDECMKQKQENKEQNIKKNVYSEVVIDGFSPVGIFCFANGAKGFDWEYKRAMELQKSFPNLKVKTFDLMKVKSGPELANMQLDLINSLRTQLTKNDYRIEMKDLPRYEMFLQKFDGLKKLDNYSEEDIEKLYKYNLELLSSFDKEPDKLFDGNLKDEEIKYILYKNIKYNIDFILAGDITLYSLERLQSLSGYKDKLNKYYDGLSEFVDLLTKVEINDNLIEQMKKESPLNFYKMSKSILNNISNSLDERQNVAKTKLENYKKRYQDLTKEEKIRKETEEKYELYFNIEINQVWYNILQNEFDDLEKRIIKDGLEESELINKKEQIEKKINDLISNNNMELSQNYQNSPEYNDIQNKINALKEQQNKLKKHPILNFRKIGKINGEINNLERNSKQNSEMFENNKKGNITNREFEIEMLKSELQSIKYQLSYNKEKKDGNKQELANLNKKVFEYFKCNSLKEVSSKIQEAKEFMKNYDYSNRFILHEIEMELQEIEQQILGQENELQTIQEERKAVAR